MPVTRANRLAVLSQLKKATKDSEVIKQFEQFLDDSNPLGDSLQSMFFAQSDYTKNMKALQAEQARLEAERAKLATDYQNLQSWRTTAEQTTEQAKQQAQQAIAAVIAQTKGKIEELKTKAQKEELTINDFNLSFDPTITAAITSASPNPTTTPNPTPAPAPTAKKESPAMNPTSTPPQDQAQAGMALIEGIASLFELSHAHEDLFGAKLDTAGLIRRAAAEGRDVREMYTELYDPESKRKEVEEKRFNDLVAQKVEEQVNSRLASIVDPSGKSQNLGDFSRIMQPSSPVFSNLGMMAKDDPQYKGDPRFAMPIQGQVNTGQDNSQAQSHQVQLPPIHSNNEDLEIAKEFMANLASRDK